MENQSLKEKLTTLTSKAEFIKDIKYLEDKIKTSRTINRRTKAGRELTQELLNICNNKVLDLIEKGEPPF